MVKRKCHKARTHKHILHWHIHTHTLNARDTSCHLEFELCEERERECGTILHIHVNWHAICWRYTSWLSPFTQSNLKRCWIESYMLLFYVTFPPIKWICPFSFLFHEFVFPISANTYTYPFLSAWKCVVVVVVVTKRQNVADNNNEINKVEFSQYNSDKTGKATRNERQI